MKLYHFTCLQHLPKIKEMGYLKLCESNIGSPVPHLLPFGDNVGPKVVWLTDCEDVKGDSHGLEDAKTKVRFTVEVDHAERWQDFATRHGINRKWYQILDKVAEHTARHWWISPVEIHSTNWIDVRILK